MAHSRGSIWPETGLQHNNLFSFNDGAEFDGDNKIDRVDISDRKEVINVACREGGASEKHAWLSDAKSTRVWRSGRGSLGRNKNRVHEDGVILVRVHSGPGIHGDDMSLTSGRSSQIQCASHHRASLGS